MSGIVADDVLVGVLHYLPIGEARCFTADRQSLQDAFHTLKMRFPTTLRVIGFRSAGGFTESAALDQAFSNLEATGLLQRQNNEPRFYFVQQVVDEAYERFAAVRLRGAGIDEAQLRRLAEEFTRLSGGRETVSTV
jgi:hypothetical protein